MKVGIIGLGRMGAPIARRLMLGNHDCVVYDIDESLVADLVADGAEGATNLEALISSFEGDRTVLWVMLPATRVQSVLEELSSLLKPGDIVIDGGNTNWRDDLERAATLGANNIHLLDVGTSGGIWGIERGFCLMVGGDPNPVGIVAPIFGTLSPGIDAVQRTTGRDGEQTPEECGWLHCGPTGSGHFVKMVHNSIEYGMMGALAEGLALLAEASSPSNEVQNDAAATAPPLSNSFNFDFDIAAIAELWRRGSVINSWLLDLTSAAFVEDPVLSGYHSKVSDSGEGRWAAQASIELGLPMPVITAALHSRFASQGSAELSGRILSALRYQFGGHRELMGPDPD